MIFCCIHDFYCSHNFSLPELNNLEHAKIILESTKNLYNAAKEKMPWFSEIQEFDEKIP